MGVYADWAAVDGQPLAGSYLPSAKVVQRACGEGFVDVNVTVAGNGGGEVNGASDSRRGLSWLGLWGAVVAALVLGVF